MSKKYSAKPKVSDDLVEQLLHNRGIVDKDDAEKFLKPDFDSHLHDPFHLPDMEKAVNRILKAIEKGQRIGIWSDYDADGIPGGALLHDFFKLLGFDNFINYIPDRHIEGYGLNTEGLEELSKDGVKLLITVDCGIRDHMQVEKANRLGMEVIITDHHEPAQDLPKAYAVVNPKRKDSKYPEKILCGAGVVWKLIEAILKTKRELLKEGQEKWLLDLVGIATLSDMVPLVGENRVLAYYGLSVLRKSRRPGLNNLFSFLKINKSNLSEDDIAFMITPRINASSRMGHPRDAFRLLTTSDEAEAQTCARHLDGINKERKTAVASIVKEAKKRIKEKFEILGDKPLIVLGNPDWRPSLLGLAASSISEEYGRPVFLWGRAYAESSAGETGILKGSCRSDGTADLVALMERSKDFFLEFGGHKLSGGFSVSHDKVHTLEDALIGVYKESCLDNGIGEMLVDSELDLNDVSESLVSKISNLSPFGVGNEKPIFIFRNILPERIDRFGKAKEHLSVRLRSGSSSSRAISFFASPDQFGDSLKEGINTNLVANIEKSFYNGSSEIRLRIVDFFK